MLYARALLLVRELHHLRRCVLVLINESTFGKEGGELKTSLGSASKFVEVHNKFMTLGGGSSWEPCTTLRRTLGFATRGSRRD